jgi:hypothetical protein
LGHARRLDQVTGEVLARPWADSFAMALARLRCIPHPT